MDSLNDAEKAAILGFGAVPRLGFWTLKKMSESGESLSSLFEPERLDSLRELLSASGAKISPPESWPEFLSRYADAGRKRLQQLREKGVELLLPDEPRFPAQLREIPDPPPWLFVRGSITALEERGLAIVGTRTPSRDGLFLAEYVGACLHGLQTTTISGLAEGIDQAIHRASLRFGVPTVAVLGTGILKTFPKGAEDLANQIVDEGGALVSEYLPTDTYSRATFVRRNRLQSGLARLVLPVEWRTKSGTAHTVRFAAKQHRELVCLRHIGWGEREELAMARSLGATVFVIPGEGSEFRERLMTPATPPEPVVPRQRSLF